MNVPNRRGHESPLFEPLNVTTTTSAVAGRADDTALAFVDCSLVANQPPAAAAAGGVEGWMTLELQFTVGPIRVQAELICFDPGRLKGTWFQPLTLTWFGFKRLLSNGGFNLCRRYIAPAETSRDTQVQLSFGDAAVGAVGAAGATDADAADRLGRAGVKGVVHVDDVELHRLAGTSPSFD
jgi:hypothetical protein